MDKMSATETIDMINNAIAQIDRNIELLEKLYPVGGYSPDKFGEMTPELYRYLSDTTYLKRDRYKLERILFFVEKTEHRAMDLLAKTLDWDEYIESHRLKAIENACNMYGDANNPKDIAEILKRLGV
jgi:hypothetical protein